MNQPITSKPSSNPPQGLHSDSGGKQSLQSSAPSISLPEVGGVDVDRGRLPRSAVRSYCKDQSVLILNQNSAACKTKKCDSLLATLRRSFIRQMLPGTKRWSPVRQAPIGTGSYSGPAFSR